MESIVQGRIAKRTGLHMDLKCNMKCLNLSRCLSPDSQILISTRMSEVSRPNNDACEGLSFFVGWFRIIVRWCMLRGYEKSSRGAVLGYSGIPHPISLIESRGQILMFSET